MQEYVSLASSICVDGFRRRGKQHFTHIPRNAGVSLDEVGKEIRVEVRGFAFGEVYQRQGIRCPHDCVSANVEQSFGRIETTDADSGESII